MSHPLDGTGRRVYSQNEEDGVLEAIFTRLGVERGYCVDVGAHDGVHLSNTANLLRHHRWRGVLIECGADKARKLRETTRELEDVRVLETRVALDGADTLDGLLRGAGAPSSPDLLSIDIDGLDYHVWASLEAYAPTVVVIEYNPTIPNHVRFVQEPDPRLNHGSSLRAFVELGAHKGYIAAHVTPTNLIAIRRDAARTLGIPELPLDALHDDRPLMTCLFQGFDGTLFLDGPAELFWQHVPIDVEKIQIVPRFLRRYQPDLPRAMRVLRAGWIASYLLRRPAFWPVLRDKVARGLRGTKPPPPRF